MIPYGRHYIDEADVEAVVDVLRHGALTQGPKIAELEEAVARYVVAKYAVAVSSGTAALHLACLAADIGSGDNVITSPNTFVASANCALYVGAIPQFADINAETLNLDPQCLAAKCKDLKKVRAIIPVHFAGLPCDMPSIRAIADKYGSIVIEDAAHALGASYPGGAKVGSCTYSHMTVFSFHPVKAIAAGEGGMITTNDEKLYRRLLRLRSHGINKMNDPIENPGSAFQNGQLNRWYYEMQELGYNYRITDIQSALALSQFGKLGHFLDRRRELRDRYDAAFKVLTGLTRTQTKGTRYSAHHLYVVRIGFAHLRMTRTNFMSALAEKGIGSQVHYIPVYFHPHYRKMGLRLGMCPVAEAYYKEALSLPLFYGLTQDQQHLVITEVSSLLS